MNRVVDFENNDYGKEIKKQLVSDLYERKAGISIINKGKTSKLVTINKNAQNWLIFDGKTNNIHKEIEDILGIELDCGYCDSKISITNLEI